MAFEKLRYLADNGNIGTNRCIEIAKAADAATAEYAAKQDMNQFAAAMNHCCGKDPDEAAFYRAAVDSILQEKWRAKPKDSAVLVTSLDMAYNGNWPSSRPQNLTSAASGKGCLLIVAVFALPIAAGTAWLIV